MNPNTVAGGAPPAFEPPRYLRWRHAQTVLSRWSPRVAGGHPPAGDWVLACRDGVRLKALVTPGAENAPLAIVVHGWLGDAVSRYVLRTAAALHANGFRVARLLLRDHGDTVAYNREMFDSARLDEVVDACNGLIERHASDAAAGIVGFSLGGNFALRIACHARADPRLQACLAVSPVIDPAATVRAIDTGWVVYRKWFVRRWRQALAAKRAAFPAAYSHLDGALRLATVGAITDYVVDRYLPYRDCRDYYSRYDLRGDVLARLRMNARIIAAVDDPVVPGAAYDEIASSDRLELRLSRFGGHCGFVADWKLASHLDAEIVHYLPRPIAGDALV